MPQIANQTQTKVILGRADLEAALDLPGAPFVAIITRTLKVGGDGMVKKHRASGLSTAALYPKGIRVVRSVVIRAGRNYERDVINQRIAESGNADSPFYGKTPEEIREIGYQSEGLHRGKTRSIGRHLGQHSVSGQVYFVYSPDQRRDSAEVRAATWERYINAATGKELEEWELADVKENLFPAKSKTHKQGVKHDRARRTLKIENLLSVKAGDTFNVDGENFIL
jgi:hypothetical protein